MTREIRKPESSFDLTTDIDRAFDDMRAGLLDAFGIAPFGRPLRIGGGEGGLLRAARTDVEDTGGAYKIVADVPGIPKEKIEIRVRGTNVEIRGEHASAAEAPAGRYVHRERRAAGFFRSVELPEPVVAADAKAKVENGVLELELPKLHPAPTTDEVRVSVQ